MCRLSRNPGSLNLLEPPAPVLVCTVIVFQFGIIIIIIIIITAIEFSLGGSSPYTSTDKTNNIHKWNHTKTRTNNTKHSKYKHIYYQNTHT